MKILYLISVLLLCSLTSCIQYAMIHENQSDHTASISLEYKKPMSVIEYKYRAVKTERQPENFRLDHTFIPIPTLHIEDNGDIDLHIDTVGRFISYEKYAVIEVPPHKTLSMGSLIPIPSESETRRYASFLEKVTIKLGNQETTHTGNEDLYQIVKDINTGIVFLPMTDNAGKSN